MKSTLTAFAALAALALPAGLPTLASAQELTIEGNASAEAPSAAPSIIQVQDRGNRGDRSGRGGGRRESDGGGRRGGGGEGGWSRDQSGGAGERGGWNRGEGRDRGEGRRDRGDRPGGWTPPTQPATPSVTSPSQPQDGRGGWNRGGDGRRGDGDRDWSRGDRGGQERDRGGRDRDRGDRDGRGWDRDRNGGGWNRGQDRGGQDRGGWDRDRNRGGQWDRNRDRRRDYDGFRNRWNQDHWRRDWHRNRGHDWWRNDRGFRGYSGFRYGFYFAPGYGYYSVPRNYWGQRWYVGDYLPSVFWRYRLNDWRTFGLGFPPPGTQWVSVDNHIYLIDSIDGYIIEVIFDAWRW